MAFDMIFNGQILPIRVKKVSGRGPLEQVVTWQERNGGDGSRVLKKRLPMRNMDVEFSIRPDGLQDLRNKVNEINTILYTGAGDLETKTIEFTDEQNIVYYGIMDGSSNWEETMYKGNGTLPFSREPFKESKTSTVAIVGTNPVNNLGNYESPAQIDLTFLIATNEYAIKHDQSGKEIRLIWDFVPGSKVSIDLDKRKVLIDGNLKMTAWDWKSQPFKLSPGVNTFTISKSTAIVQTKITYRSRWV
jgi:predicted phage tail component-like protein